MGDFYCKNCDMHKEFDSLDQAIAEFDHAVAMTRNRRCPNNNLDDIFWDGIPVSFIKTPHRYPPATNPKLVPRK